MTQFPSVLSSWIFEARMVLRNFSLFLLSLPSPPPLLIPSGAKIWTHRRKHADFAEMSINAVCTRIPCSNWPGFLWLPSKHKTCNCCCNCTVTQTSSSVIVKNHVIFPNRMYRFKWSALWFIHFISSMEWEHWTQRVQYV